MRLLKRLWRTGAVTLPTLADKPGPETTILAIQPDQTNPIHRLIDNCRLPWREPRKAVEAREGRSLDPLYEREAIFFTRSPIPPGFLQPWRADVFERYAPDMPVVRFAGIMWFSDNAETNINLAAEHFATQLAPASIGQEYNTLVCRWRSGSASLELKSWPPALQSHGLSNDAYARDHRLMIACHLTLLTGFRLPLSPEEQGWVNASRPIATTRPFLSLGSGRIEDFAPLDTEVEYARDPAGISDRIRNQVGVSSGREALILCTHQLFVLPARDVLGFDVIRMLPAKGGGGSTVQVRCRTTCPGVPYKKLSIADDPDPDGMTELGQELAGIFRVPCDLGPYFPDA